LFPLIVSLHLMGGMVLLVLLVCQTQGYRTELWRMKAAHGHLRDGASRAAVNKGSSLTRLLYVCMGVLALQIFLGAWVSTNYAVLACEGFPTCQGSFWPEMNFSAGFELWRPLGLSGAGEVLEFKALVAIHFVHRLMAADVVITNHRGSKQSEEDQTPPTPSTNRHLAMYQDLLGIRHVATQELLTLDTFLARHTQTRICAAAAIGEPAQFFKGLRQLGLTLTKTVALTDHRALDPGFLASIDCPIILITAKDAIKCDPKLDQRLWSVEVDTRFEDQTFGDWLDSKLTQIQRNKKSLGLQ